MSTAALTARRPVLAGRPIVASLLLLMGAIVTTAATLAGNGNVVFGAVPVVLAVIAYAFYILPVRYSVYALLFLSLGIDAASEGPWDSPLAPIGNLLAFNLSHSVGISFLKFPGIAVALVAMSALLLLRRFGGDRIDTQGGTPAALPLFGALAISFATALMLIALGAVRGGDVQMAKIQVQTYLILLGLAYVCAMSFRDVHDYRMVGRIIVGAALLRSFYVMYVVHRMSPTLLPGQELHAAATHGDSLLFATAVVLLIVRFMEVPSARTAGWCALFLPILLIGMQLNNRRIVWVELAAGLMAFAFLSRKSLMKRLVVKTALVSLPLIVAYIGVGWNSQSKIFKPIAMYRSVTDGKVDSSTLYRDLENYNLLMTMRLNPMTGTGFGQPFMETVKLPDISFFAEYRFLPHNAILGLWAYTGPIGFTGLTMSLVVAMYLAMRSYRLTDSADERIAAVMVTSVFVIYLAHCWGDIGFSERRTIHLVGPALAMAGQLATRTGAYKRRQEG
jgi:hypothetical protein